MFIYQQEQNILQLQAVNSDKLCRPGMAQNVDQNIPNQIQT